MTKTALAGRWALPWVCALLVHTGCDKTEKTPGPGTQPAAQKKAVSPANNGDKPRLTVSMCEMLGMLDEYISRFNKYNGKPHPGLVESFYDAEGELVDRFEELIHDYRKETGNAYHYTKKVTEAGGVIFRSEELSRLINSFYVKDKSRGSVGTLDRRVLDEVSEACSLAYIEGAYRRFGHEQANAIRMANGYEKILTLAHVLRKLGCKEVQTLACDGLPMSNMVVFQPAGKLAERLPIKRKITPVDLKDYKPFGEQEPAHATFRDIIIVFHNHMWDVDHVDRFVRIFFTRDQVLSCIDGLEGFERASSNKYFTNWLRALRQPGFHVYGEGFRDLGPLVTRLMETEPGWICCGPMGAVLKTSDVETGRPTKDQLEQVRKTNPEIDADQLYFQMQEIGHKVRIWIHQAYRPTQK